MGSPIPPYAQQDPDTTPRGRIPDKETALIILHEMLEREPYVPRTPARSWGRMPDYDAGLDPNSGWGGHADGNGPGENGAAGFGAAGSRAPEAPDDRDVRIKVVPLPEGVERRIRKMIQR